MKEHHRKTALFIHDGDNCLDFVTHALMQYLFLGKSLKEIFFTMLEKAMVPLKVGLLLSCSYYDS